ncbi:MAG: glycosyltransferase family 4 protein [Candidatus Paceibacterota bacterium]|jgi:glycosyltransferase involved in cell wall biosynthesis
MTNKSVILRGPLLTSSGYGVHARQIASWLFGLADSRGDLEVCTETLPWGNTPWITDMTACGGLVGRIVQSIKQKQKYDVSIQLQLPNEWNPFLADYNVGMTAAVETTNCNPAWVEAANKMDLIIVPSEFVRQVFLNSGTMTTRIEVVPEAFIDAILDESIVGLDLGLETKFNFLLFGQFTGNNPENDRKNLFYTIKWLAETFKDNADIGVVIKTNLSRNTSLDRVQAQSLLSQLLLETKKGVGPKFSLLHGDMSDKDVAALYKSPNIHCLLSLTRGEGFGLPILEAAASGLPVMVTNWSAHTEFLKQGKYMKVDYRLAPVHETRVDGQIFMQGAQWAQVVEDDVKRKLKKLVESPALPRQWAKDLAVSVKQTHSLEAIKNEYNKVFKDII